MHCVDSTPLAQWFHRIHASHKCPHKCPRQSVLKVSTQMSMPKCPCQSVHKVWWSCCKPCSRTLDTPIPWVVCYVIMVARIRRACSVGCVSDPLHCVHGRMLQSGCLWSRCRVKKATFLFTRCRRLRRLPWRAPCQLAIAIKDSGVGRNATWEKETTEERTSV